MPRLLVLALPALLAGAALAGAAQGQERQRSFTQEYSFHASGTVDVSNYKGTIEVVPWGLEEVQVSVTIEAEDADGEIMLPHVDVHITGSLDALSVETDYRRALHEIRTLLPDATAPRLPPVHLVLRIPATARLRIDDYMSTIRLDGFAADLEVYTYKGDVDIRGFSGALRLDTHMGHARVAFSQLRHDSAIGVGEGEATVALPPGSGFDLAVDLDAAGARFEPDSSFAGLRSSYHQADRPVQVNVPVNGGGPRLALRSRTGALRLTSGAEEG